MIQYKSDCEGCNTRCIGYSCPMMHAPHWYCDRCKQETDPRYLHKVDGNELCKRCAKQVKALQKVIDKKRR